MIQLVRDKSAERGLLLNVKKTKILVVDSNREDTSAFKIKGKEIEEVDGLIYRGSTITNKGNSAPDIRRRLALAREAVTIMGNILGESKGQFESQVESWTMQKADKRRVDAFEMWCYRRVLRIPCMGLRQDRK